MSQTYDIHSIGVGQLLESFGYDDNVVAGRYLHDVVEDTKYTIEATSQQKYKLK